MLRAAWRRGWQQPAKAVAPTSLPSSRLCAAAWAAAAHSWLPPQPSPRLAVMVSSLVALLRLVVMLPRLPRLLLSRLAPQRVDWW